MNAVSVGSISLNASYSKMQNQKYVPLKKFCIVVDKRTAAESKKDKMSTIGETIVQIQYLTFCVFFRQKNNNPLATNINIIAKKRNPTISLPPIPNLFIYSGIKVKLKYINGIKISSLTDIGMVLKMIAVFFIVNIFFIL